MKYFVAYACIVDKQNLIRNEIVEVDKKIETMDDIKNIEEKITQKLHVLIKESAVSVDKKIDSVQIINYKEIEELDGLRTGEIRREGRVAENGSRKKTTLPPEGFKCEVQRLNEKVLKLLRGH